MAPSLELIEIRIRSVDVRLPIAGQSFVPNRGLRRRTSRTKARALWIDLNRKTEVEYAPGVHVPSSHSGASWALRLR